MIILNEHKDYFLLIDGQGANFAAGVLYETLEELGEQFISWADADGIESPKGWTISDCLEFWTFSLKQFGVNDFAEVSEYSTDESGRNVLSFKI